VHDLINSVKMVKGVKVLAGEAAAPDMDSLRGMVDLLRDKIDRGNRTGQHRRRQVNLVAAVTKDLLPADCTPENW
jgi:alanyl-tRNA synthetase